MFDNIGFIEMAFIATIALLVIGPKELPKVIKVVSHYVGRAKAMTRDLREGFDNIVRESELKDLKNDVEKLATDDSDINGSEAGEPNDFIKSLDAAEAAEKEAEKAAKKKPARPAAKSTGAKKKAGNRRNTSAAKNTTAKAGATKRAPAKTAKSRQAAAAKPAGTTGGTPKAGKTTTASRTRKKPSQAASAPSADKVQS